MSAPKKRSIVEQREEMESAQKAAVRKRQRMQVGRNAGDKAILAAIKVHFGKTISDDELYNNIRDKLCLYDRVERDWADKEAKGLTKFPQGYWPGLKTQYRCDEDKRTEVDKAKIDGELKVAIELYRATGKKHSTSKLYNWFASTKKCNGPTFHELARFLNGLTPITVTGDRTVVLNAMDFINNAGLRTVEYLEDYMDVVPMMDDVMVLALAGSKKDNQGLRKFVDEQKGRLSLLLDVEAVYRILDEEKDLGNRMLDLILVSQAVVGKKLFEKTKSDVFYGYIKNYTNEKIASWDERIILTKAVVDQTRADCKAEVPTESPYT